MSANAIYAIDSDVEHHSRYLTIEGTVYIYRCYFDNDGYWYFHLADETGEVHYVDGRRLLPIGPWLTVDPSSRITVRKLVDVYRLDPVGLFPGGALICCSSKPLELVQADAASMWLQYYSEATLAAAQLSGALP